MINGAPKDPVEDLDLEEERAIAAVMKARFGPGDLQGALRNMERVTNKRSEQREYQVYYRLRRQSA